MPKQYGDDLNDGDCFFHRLLLPRHGSVGALGLDLPARQFRPPTCSVGSRHVDLIFVKIISGGVVSGSSTERISSLRSDAIELIRLRGRIGAAAAPVSESAAQSIGKRRC